MKKELVIGLIIVVLIVGGYFIFFSKSGTVILECEKIKDNSAKITCYKEVAMERKDLSVCDALDKNYRESCYVGVAFVKGDISICENKITNEASKDACFSSVAATKKDFSICEKISATYRIERCYKYVAKEKGNLLECKTFSARREQYCMLGVAVANFDISICEELISDGDKEECYVDIAIETKDSSLCEKAGSWKDFCLENI